MNKYVILVFLAVILVSAFLMISPSAQERRLFKILNSLPVLEKKQISEITTFKNIQDVCLLYPYAFDYPATLDKDLEKIFGDIDFSKKRNEIARRFGGANDGYGYGLYFYPVRDKKLENSIAIVRISVRLGEKLRAGCYPVGDLCVQKFIPPDNSQYRLSVDYCQEQ